LNSYLTNYTKSQKKLVVVKRVIGFSRNLVNLKLHKGTNKRCTRHDIALFFCANCVQHHFRLNEPYCAGRKKYMQVLIQYVYVYTCSLVTVSEIRIAHTE